MRLSKKLTVDQKKQLEQMVFVGRLATQQELSLTMIDQSITFSSTTNKITFYIKCISEVPESIEDHFEYKNKIFTATTNSYQNTALMNREGADFDRLSYIELQEKVPALFHDKLIIFRLDPTDTIVYANMESFEDGKSERYFSLPGPKLRATETRDDLHDKLVKERRPIILDYYPEVLTPSPELIIYDDYIYHVDLESKSNPTTYFQRELSDVKYIKLSEEKIDYYLDIEYEDELFFISLEKYGELIDEINANGKVLNEEIDDEEALHQTQNAMAMDRVKDEDLSLGEAPSESELEKRQIQTDTELEFIEKFTHIARYKYRLYHDKEDLINLHTSIKTNTITVLGGMSGTGKSQLARAYADALELPEENLAFIPISPSYQEPDDVLGYLNPQTGVYYESETGLVNLLLKAEQDPNNLYMVVFDEMNLSQVEHWFSPFLSLLELKDNRTLRLFHESSRVINGNYKPKVNLYDNVIFIGTVNFDETTRAFSDRLLDRVNMIIPRKAKFEDTIDFYKSLDENKENEFNDVPITRKVIRDRWIHFKNVGLHNLITAEIQVLDQIHELINKNDPQKGVSFRVALAIAEFILNLPGSEDEPMIDRQKAFDYQINQRILTKINGIDSFVEPLVGHYSGTDYFDGAIAKLLKSDTAVEASEFELSLQTLKNKAKELSIYGFAN